MIEVYPNLFVGSQLDFENIVRHQQGWRVVHACKEPYHRDALGYSGRALSKAHPEYLIARRGHRLVLNLVDVDDPKYILKEVIDVALQFIRESLASDEKVLIHCNQGLSRSPSIAFLFIAAETDRFSGHEFPSALKEFRLIYPAYAPARGCAGFIETHYTSYLRPMPRAETE